METLSSSSDSDDWHERIKQIRKTTQQLEEIRKNSLATKRGHLRAKPKIKSQRPKTKFVKTPCLFAARKTKRKNSNQSRGLSLNEIDSEQTLLKTMQMKGYFCTNVKGISVYNPLEAHQHSKDIVTNGDTLQLTQKENHNSQKLSRILPNEDTDSEIRAEIAKITKSSSQGSSNKNSSLSSHKEDKSSPIISFSRNKKKEALSKLVNQPHIVNQSTKEDEYINRQKSSKDVIEDQNSRKENQKSQRLNDRLSQENLIPDDVIFFTRYTSKKKDVKSDTNNVKIRLGAQEALRFYKEINEISTKFELDSIVKNLTNDPVESIAKALKATYFTTHKKYVHKQNILAQKNCGFVSETINSSDSEIMVEPDTEIRRKIIVEKDRNFSIKSLTQNSENNSEWSNNERSNFLDTVIWNKKRFPSALAERRNWQETRISLPTKANPKNVTNRAEAKERSNSEKCYTSEKDNIHRFHRNILFTKDDVLENDLSYKGRKHVPCILKRNRSLEDCMEKEKKLLSNNGCSNSESGSTTSFENLIDGNKISNVEKPKYVNVKYNKSLKTFKKVPKMENRKFSRSTSATTTRTTAADPKMHLPEPPKKKENEFIKFENIFCPSPIDPRINFSDYRNDSYQYQSSQDTVEHNSQNYCRSELSQGNIVQENNTGMVRMLSFGEIQERTDRLTLRSSQGQMCSQENRGNISFAPDKYHNISHQKHNKSSIYNNQICSTYVPTPQIFNIPMQPSSHDCCSHSSFVNSNEARHSSSQNDKYKMMSSSSNCCDREATNIAYHVNDYQKQKNQTDRGTVQHQNIQQAVKFVAIENNNLPQRRPIYTIPENNYVHKASNSSQQYAPIVEPLYMENVLSNSSGYVASIPLQRFYEQGAYIANPDSEYNKARNANNISVTNIQRPVNFENPNFQQVGWNRNNLNQNNMSNQILINDNQEMLVRRVVGNVAHDNNVQQYGERKVLVEEQLVPYTQLIGYQAPARYYSIEDRSVNNAYLQQMGRHNSH